MNPIRFQISALLWYNWGPLCRWGNLTCRILLEQQCKNHPNTQAIVPDLAGPKTTLQSWWEQKFRAVCHTLIGRVRLILQWAGFAKKRARAIQANLLTSQPNSGQFGAALTENVCNWECLWRHFKLAVWVSATNVLAHCNFYSLPCLFLSFPKSLVSLSYTHKQQWKNDFWRKISLYHHRYTSAEGK